MWTKNWNLFWEWKKTFWEKEKMLQGQNLVLAKCRLHLKNASRKIKHLNLFASPIFWLIYIGQSENRRQEMRRYCLCAVMICNQDNVIQSCNRIIPGSRKIKVVIRIVPWCTLVYSTDTLPMYIRNVTIVTLGIFHEDEIKHNKTVFVYLLRHVISY